MAGEQFKAEVDAIGAVLGHLEPLTGPARERVLEYVLRALDISSTGPVKREDTSGASNSDVAPIVQPGAGVGDRIHDIRSLHDEKQPKSAIEMAAIVGYYLGELAPEEERSDTIVTADLDRLFKSAKYPLPTKMRDILGNAAAAGYFDQAGRGRYRLNPVGHNLVVHNLPSSEGAAPARRRTPRKTTAKKTAAKKSTAKKTAAKKSTAKKSTATKSAIKKSAS